MVAGACEETWEPLAKVLCTGPWLAPSGPVGLASIESDDGRPCVGGSWADICETLGKGPVLEMGGGLLGAGNVPGPPEGTVDLFLLFFFLGFGLGFDNNGGAGLTTLLGLDPTGVGPELC